MSSPRPNPSTILIVDDDAAVRQILGRVLAREGHTVLEAGDSTRAAELAERHRPQLAVLDLCLADGDGADLAGRLHARQAGLPLILITGYPLRLHEKPDLSRPFLRVLTKPVDVTELRLAVNTALSESAMPTPNPPRPPDPVAVTPPPNGPAVALPAAETTARTARRAGFMSTAVVVAGLVVLAGFVAFVVGVPLPGLSAHEPEVMAREPARPNVGLVPDRQHTLAVPEDVRASLGIRKDGKDRITTAQVPTEKLPLALSGSTAFDPAGLMRVRARFAPAEAVAIGTFEDTSRGTTIPRELRPGDVVRKDQPLVTFYSVDVGTKKNDLVDALVSLKLDQELLDASQRAYDKGSLPALDLLAAKSKVQGDANSINRAENTLRAWNVPPEDIEAVRKEAEEIIKHGGRQAQTPEEREKQLDRWARVVLKAPRTGVIVERNVALNETVVDNTINLFQIARVDPLQVIANAPEDELPKLQALLDGGEHKWKVRLLGATNDIDGTIDTIGYLIDVNQHSAFVKGHIPNADRRLRSGQFVTATIEQAPPDDVVEVPMSALVDDGKQTVVFVREDPKKPDELTMRRVEVTRRFERRSGDPERVEQRAFVRSRFDGGKADELPPEAEGLLPRRPLKPDEQVITAGVLELKKELEDRESEAAKKP
jgi:cobalt-zinc-cadmium efflux system membrane fusion protein